MVAESMDASSNTRMVHIAGIPAQRTAWRSPDSKRAYTENSLRPISPKLIAEEEERRESLPVNPDAKYENRKYLLSEKMVESAVIQIEDLLKVTFRHLSYNYHEKSGEYFVKVIDDETEEVIREIPPEKILDIVASMKEIVGLLFDERR
jgi:flagellar protein FlaG